MQGLYRVEGFPKLGIPFLGVPIIRLVIFGVYIWVPRLTETITSSSLAATRSKGQRSVVARVRFNETFLDESCI